MHEAQYHAETHKMSVLDFQEETTEYRKLYSDIEEFLESSNVSISAINSN